MSREDSYGYDPMQSKAYDSNVHFGMPQDAMTLCKARLMILMFTLGCHKMVKHC
jgi:hypothetical protein